MQFPCYISFFVYTFCRLLSFSQKLNMTFQDFHNVPSDYNVTTELFRCGLCGNYPRISVAIETSAKCTHFTVMLLKTNILFLKPKIIYSALSFYAVLLSTIFLYGLQKKKGKHEFRKIQENCDHLLTCGIL